MASDIKVTVDYSDLKLLTEWLNKTDQSVKVVTNTVENNFQTFKKQKMELENVRRSIDPLYNATVAYNQKLEILNRELRDTAPALYAKNLELLKKQAQLAGLELDRFNNVIGMSNKGTRHTQLLVQQAGYQFGDFFTQIAMGQNPLMAFSTQMTQLTGFLQGKWIPYIGVAIAALGALGVAIDKIPTEMKRAQEALENLSTATTDATDEVERLRRGFESLEELKAVRAIEEVQKRIAAVKAQVDEFDVEGQFALEGVLSDENKVLDDLVAKLEELRQARRDAAAIEEGERQLEQYNERLAKLGEENDLLRIRREYGEDSVAESDYLLKLKQDELNALRDAGFLTQEQVDAEMRLVREQAELNRQLTEAEAKGNALADALERAASAMASLTSFGANIDKQLEVAIAQVEALRNGQDAAVAGQIAGLRIDLEARRQEAIRSGADPFLANAEAAISSAQIDELERQRNTAAQLREQQRKSGSGSSKSDPYIEQLLAEAQYKREIVGLSDEEIRRKEILRELSKQNQTATEAEIQQIISLEAETRKLVDAQNKAEKQQEFYKDTILEGLESIVDGSKSVNEAFRDMLRTMVYDIYKQVVLNPISDMGANFLSKLLGQANGGAWNNGVQMFANGGVVGSPTLFGHSGGLGVMGEAGPEAIMPLKRGADGKLGVAGGSGGPTQVHVTYNIIGNGDEFIMGKIAQAAPQIAQLTQTKIMNDRRRGGQMKATFS